MHTDYAPDEITEDHIENMCDDLRCALITILENDGGDDEDYDKAVQILQHIDGLLHDMTPDE